MLINAREGDAAGVCLPAMVALAQNKDWRLLDQENWTMLDKQDWTLLDQKDGADLLDKDDWSWLDQDWNMMNGHVVDWNNDMLLDESRIG